MRAAENNWLYLKKLPLFYLERWRLLITSFLSMCLSRGLIAVWCCFVNWVIKILIQAIPNVVMSCRFSTAALLQ